MKNEVITAIGAVLIFCLVLINIGHEKRLEIIEKQLQQQQVQQQEDK